MVKREELRTYLDTLLQLDRVCERSNNGLQVEGGDEVNKMFFSVDTSISLIEKAVEAEADFIFVHHGLSWGDNLRYLTNYKARILRPLFNNEISFYGAHLPLDAHPDLGHNALLADMLHLKEKKTFAKYSDIDIGFTGLLPVAQTAKEISSFINNELSELITSYSHHFPGCPNCSFILDNGKKNKKVGVISGGAGVDGVMAAINEGVDCLVTGEFNHMNYHLAKENNLAIVAAGHYRSETPGLFAVMDLIQQKFGIITEFINIPTGL